MRRSLPLSRMNVMYSLKFPIKLELNSGILCYQGNMQKKRQYLFLNVWVFYKIILEPLTWFRRKRSRPFHLPVWLSATICYKIILLQSDFTSSTWNFKLFLRFILAWAAMTLTQLTVSLLLLNEDNACFPIFSSLTMNFTLFQGPRIYSI